LFSLLTEDDLGGVCSMDGSLLQILVGKPEGRDNLRNPRHRQNDNIKIHFWGEGYEMWSGFIGHKI